MNNKGIKLIKIYLLLILGLFTAGYSTKVTDFVEKNELENSKRIFIVKPKEETKPAEVKEKKPFTPNGAKLGEDEGSIDGEWLKAQIVEDKVPEYIQIVNVLSEKDFKKGHIKGSINIEADKLSAKELFEKLPKGKTIVFNCSAGARSIEAWSKLKKDQVDVSDILYFDANVTCEGENCKIEVNEPLGA